MFLHLINAQANGCYSLVTKPAIKMVKLIGPALCILHFFYHGVIESVI
jgi:hypothetical protein